MRCTNPLDRCVSLLFRTLALCIIGVILTLTGFRYVQAAQINVSGSCGLVDAISSANTDSSVGTCTPGSGADTVILSNTVYVLTAPDNSFDGDNNALPAITSTVTISGSGDGFGSVLLRNPGFSCPAAQANQEFRFFYVNTNGDLTLKGVTLQNGCWNSGGAIWSEGGPLTLLDSTLVSNTAKVYGGAIYAVGPVTITQSSFISNVAEIDGGAVYLFEGRVQRSSFTANSADGEGGALFLSGPDDKYIVYNHIFENHAEEEGAALYLYSGAARLDNNLIVGNVSGASEAPADIALGAVENPSTLYAHHNTLVAGSGAESTAVLAGVDVAGDHVFMTDTIFSGYDFGLVTAQDANIVANGVLWDNTTGLTTTLSGAITVTNDISGSAAFVNPAANDYHLTLVSDAVNNGVSNIPPADYDGDIRPFGGASDLGYDELVATIGIAITKTVGTNASACADTDALTVDENTAVFYCFTVQNTGDVTFTHHTFTDALLGVDTTLDFDLGPSETRQITRSLISELGPYTVTESVTNTVSVTSTNVENPDDTSVQSVEQLAATASDSNVAVITAETPTGLPVIDQPIDNRLYLPALH